jgi:hypothetical protein
LAFSPDSAHLAIGTLSGVSIANVKSGELGRLARDSAMHVRWSADGKTLTAVSGLSIQGGANGLGPFSDIYPVVRVLDNAVVDKGPGSKP